jgi:hypothetical protein
MASPDEFFNGTLAAFRAGTLPKYKVFDLGLSPELGIQPFPRAMIFMPQSVLFKAVEKHGIDLEILRNLPSLIGDLRALFKSKTVAHSFVIQLDATWQGHPLVVAVEHVRHPDFGTSYMAKSIHVRQTYQLDIWTNDGLRLFLK